MKRLILSAVICALAICLYAITENHTGKPSSTYATVGAISDTLPDSIIRRKFDTSTFKLKTFTNTTGKDSSFKNRPDSMRAGGPQRKKYL